MTPDDASKGNDGRTLETVGVIGLAVGAAAAVGGLVWHFTEPTSRPASGALHVTPVLYRPSAAGRGDFTGVSVSGRLRGESRPQGTSLRRRR